MDIRVEKTKRSILNAFLELRGRKPLERITVKELCQRAQINKSTFYDHYADVYDLSEQVETEIIKAVVENVPHPEYMFQRPKAFIQELYQAYVSQGVLLQTVFSGSRSSRLVDSIQKELVELALDKFPQYRGSPAAHIVLCHCLYGSYYTLAQKRDLAPEAVLEITGEIAERAIDLI